MSTTHYFWDDEIDAIIEESNDIDQTTAAYTLKPVTYGRLVSESRDSQSLYHEYDDIRSTRQIADDTGNIIDTMIYDAWGNIVSLTGLSFSPYLWIGELGYYADSETGLHYVRRRSFDPKTSRWTSRDPWELTSLSFLYADNAPTQRYDPSGLITIYSASGIKALGFPGQSPIHADVMEYVRSHPPAQYGGSRESQLVGAVLLTKSDTEVEADLNNEALTLASQNRLQGEFCCHGLKTTVGVVMVGPKANVGDAASLQNDPRNCCDIRYLIFRDDKDRIVSPHGSEAWGGVPSAVEHIIVLSGGYRHGWEKGIAPDDPSLPKKRRASIEGGSPVSQGNAAAGTYVGFVQSGTSSTPVDYSSEIEGTLAPDLCWGYICHSQGCNITLRELQRACLPQ